MIVEFAIIRLPDARVTAGLYSRVCRPLQQGLGKNLQQGFTAALKKAANLFTAGTSRL